MDRETSQFSSVADMLRAYRGGDFLNGRTASFALYGPSCDASDMLPGRVELPEDIRAGDYLEFGDIGDYSLSGRTRSNRCYSDRIIQISPIEKS